MQRHVTVFKGYGGVIEKITREELDMLMYFNLAEFVKTEFNPVNNEYVDYWRAR